jgi:ElaB/YqjD/DUF883 family membrane-anchored ribosome-binding protein
MDTASSASRGVHETATDALDAQDTGRQAAGAVREISDTVVETIDESIRSRPYTTLAIVAGLGFVLGAALRR